MFSLSHLEDDITELKIRKYPGDEYGDEPNALRWRAWWDNGLDSTVNGISLRCYPVTKLTPAGAWIDPDAWTQHSRDGIEWQKSHAHARWVSNDGGAAWAKRTQDEALNSLAIRYKRWSQRIVSDASYFIQASRALKFLMPERIALANDGLRTLSHYVASETAEALQV